MIIKRTVNGSKTVFQSVIVLASLSVSMYMLLFNEPENGYELLFVLPFSFSIMLLLSRNCWKEMPENFGITVLTVLEFIRLVVSPILVVSAGYYELVRWNDSSNNSKGIMLIAYEAVCIGLALRVYTKTTHYKTLDIDDAASNRRMNHIVLALISITLAICVLAPEILIGYRTIFGLFTDISYTSVEQSMIVSEYSSSFFKKLLLVTGNYLFKVVRILVPTYILVVIRNRTARVYRIICYAIILSPFFIVDGTIARSLFYSVFLLIIYYQLYGMDMKKMIVPIVASGILVGVYFWTRFSITGGTDFVRYMAEKSIDYFAGANVVGATFNLPQDFGTRFKYFGYDLLRTIPYANTIFGLNSGDNIQRFFNLSIGMTGGQIPPTIGMGSYYFSVIFAPAYSIIFARTCKKYGRKSRTAKNPYYRLVYIYMSFITALGICMYSIDVTLLTMTQVILPIYIIARICYKPIPGSYYID